LSKKQDRFLCGGWYSKYMTHTTGI